MAELTRIQQKNRSLILRAGLAVFSEAGFNAATLDRIAKAAGLSKPNLLYYFPSKAAIHTALLEETLEMWLAPLHEMSAQGDPVEEILTYVRRKLEMSRDHPAESRLFANEILRGAPHISETLQKDLKTLVEEKCEIIARWRSEGRIADVDPKHLIFSIWAQTQHYADFEVQVRAILGGEDPFPEALRTLETLFRKTLTPSTVREGQ